MGGAGVGHWLVRMEWRLAGQCVCLCIFPCTIKSRSSLLAPAHPGGPGKTAVKRLWCGDYMVLRAYVCWQLLLCVLLVPSSFSSVFFYPCFDQNMKNIRTGLLLSLFLLKLITGLCDFIKSYICNCRERIFCNFWTYLCVHSVCCCIDCRESDSFLTAVSFCVADVIQCVSKNFANFDML